jgi:hypothetical protein
MACSTTRRAFVAKSSSLRLVTEPSCHESGAHTSPENFKLYHYRGLTQINADQENVLVDCANQCFEIQRGICEIRVNPRVNTRKSLGRN